MKAYSDLRFHKTMAPEDKLKRAKWLLFQTGVTCDYENTPIEKIRKMALNAAEESVFEFHLEALKQFADEYCGDCYTPAKLVKSGLKILPRLTLKQMFALRSARLFAIVTNLDLRAQDSILHSVTAPGLAPGALIDFSTHVFGVMCDVLRDGWENHEKNVIAMKNKEKRKKNKESQTDTKKIRKKA